MTTPAGRDGQQHQGKLRKRELPIGIRCRGKNVSLPDRHRFVVTQNAKLWGISFSEMLRRVIDDYDSRHPLPAIVTPAHRYDDNSNR